MLLGLLLARGGVEVTVLEKHGDFLRDFRGDTVHPSTLEVLDAIGLLPRFDALPQHRESQLSVLFADGMVDAGDFRGVGRFPFLAFVPQWDLLDLLADAGRDQPSYRLRLSTEATGLVVESGRVVGVQARGPEGALEIRADLVVAADGRGSTLRAAAGLAPEELGAPMDVLWFRMPRAASDPEHTFFIAGRGQILAMIHRNDYWQIAFMIPKGAFASMRAHPLADFQRRLAQAAPLLADRVETLRSYDDLHLLEVRVDRLLRWHLPGLLFIGDAAHAMSPVGGVGINLAIQDAVAAANLVGPALRGGGPIGDDLLARVQARRLLPTRIIQALQVLIQRRVIVPALHAEGGPPPCPPLVRTLLRVGALRRIPAHVFGLGFRRETLTFGVERPGAVRS
jgi:2-polyprenyl-6-methoxyphenol hydroxylase-like FAD-dependent oxidoreductase